MRKDGQATRDKILDGAHKLIMSYGFGGTTVDEVIEAAGITKGAFFYHFKSKEDLARALVQRYASADDHVLIDALTAAEKKTSDPVEQLLAIVDFYIASLEIDPHMDGCLYASYCYESGLLDDQTLKPVRDAVLNWREKISAKITAAMAQRPPRVPVDAAELADNFLGTFEGGFILGRTLNDPKIIVRQLRLFRSFLAALFAA